MTVLPYREPAATPPTPTIAELSERYWHTVSGFVQDLRSDTAELYRVRIYDGNAPVGVLEFRGRALALSQGSSICATILSAVPHPAQLSYLENTLRISVLNAQGEEQVSFPR